jgi:hypothetical protein
MQAIACCLAGNPTKRIIPVWGIPRARAIAKILVEGSQDTFLAVRMGKNLSIAGITVPLPTPDDVMTCFTQGLKDTAPDAGVE